MAVLEGNVTQLAQAKMQKNGPNQSKKVFFVLQELKLARMLAGNTKTARDRGLKSLKKHLQRSTVMQLTDSVFQRLWKGLFFCMWNSDKPLIQEECAENIASLCHVLPLESSLLFTKCGYSILANEWHNIDQLRMDKFLMFVRRLLRQSLFVVKNQKWSKDTIAKYCQILSQTILDPFQQIPMGLRMHFIEIFLEELAKVSNGTLQSNLMTDFLSPFINLMASTDDPRILDHLKRFIFRYLMRQSAIGLEYEEKYEAWKRLGFPGTINSMRKIGDQVEVNDDDDDGGEQTEQVFDPRAGRVNVDLPQIKFNARKISEVLSEKRAKKTIARKAMKVLSEEFAKLHSGIYPLGVKKVAKISKDDKINIKKACNSLVKFDRKIQDKKRKKKRKTEDIVLRSGKKIKLMDDFVDFVQKEADMFDSLKRKYPTESASVSAKKQKLQVSGEVESIFQRNSGTWMVTRTSPNSQGSVKNVKININLNESQNFEDHIAQILSSPVPYDPNKKPLKPLLKRTRSGPINPFYKFKNPTL